MDAKEAIEELRLSALGEWVPNKEAVEVAIQALRDVSILEYVGHDRRNGIWEAPQAPGRRTQVGRRKVRP